MPVLEVYLKYSFLSCQISSFPFRIMTALGNVCNQTLDLIFILIITVPQGASFWYWYWMTWGTFPPIFQLHPDSIPVWKEFFATIFLLLSKSSKTEILQILSRTIPTIYVLFAKKWKNRIAKFWQNIFPPSTCSLQYCHQRSWYLGKQWNEGKKHSREATHTKLDGILEDA